ncbi:methyl-coenzyme M reductase [Acinetobacter radioresistens]|uniref:methyl-coenzyme M reductase n=1 Tax=Acinetobacter radioresistens TaxID=40216 RepID=UPI0022478A62|nr:methyl-coenzyme M reductase [Acinetobacter radioresistens]MCX0338285.1 methyl-coenzyme M reductase [Acinetobacter radioresistens]
MAIIPRSQGRIVPDAPMARQVPMTGLGRIGEAVSGALEQHEAQRQEQEVSAKRLELYNNDLAEKEAKVKVDDVLTTGFTEKVTLLRNDVANGARKAQDADADLEAWSNEQFKQLENDLPIHARQDFRTYWDSTVNKQRSNFLPLQLKADEQKSGQLAEQMFQIATRLPPAARKEYLKTNLATLNIPEATKSDLYYKLDVTSDQMDIDQRVTAAVDKNDVESLQTLVTDLDSGKYGYLDGPTIQKNKASALSRLRTIQDRQEIEQKKRETEAEKNLNNFVSNVLTGRELDKSYIENVGTLVSGTSMQGEYEFYLKQSDNFQSFSKLSSAEQARKISDMKAQIANSPSADPVAENKILSAYERIYVDRMSTLKDDPNLGLRERGIQLPELDPTEMKLAPASAAKKLVEIGSYQIAQKKKDPNAVIKPISPAEVNGLKDSFDAMPVNQKLDFIGSLISESRGIKDGPKIWGSVLGQLGGGDMSYVMAGVARMYDFRSQKGEDVAAAIISGTQVLKNKQLVMPKDELLNEKFNEYVGQSAGGAVNMTFAAYKSIYAHLTEREGYQHKDKDDIEERISNAALGMATGGTYTQGNFTSYTGNKIKDWKVSKPYGMSDSRFEAHLDGMYEGLSRKHGVPESELRSLRLHRGEPNPKTGAITYDLINERGTPLYNGTMPEWIKK